MPRVSVSAQFSTSQRAVIGVLALALGLAGANLPLAAQPVVQPIPSGDSRTLNAALARVAANPRDSGALVDAGNAALVMNDIDAAIGFFTRADQVAPGNARAKAGLAGAYVRREDPFTAIRLFDEAERHGPLPGDLLADRGLAYDLVGDNATAQRVYRQAGANNDEAARRLAVSLAISGDKRGSEAALSPLMNRRDKSAWRTRAFSLAILGEEAQAVQIANSTMPATLASGVAPYLRYMRQLTRAQQAAAANLGHFPRASEIGRDDPRIAQYSLPTVRRPATGADAGLIPAGEPLGSARAAATGASRSRGTAQTERPSRQERQAQERQARLDREAKDRQARQAQQNRQGRGRERERPPEPVVAVSTAARPSTVLAAARPVVSPTARPAVRSATARPVPSAANVPGFALAPAASSVAPPPGPSFNLAPSPNSPSTAITTAPVAAPPTSPPAAVSSAAAVAAGTAAVASPTPLVVPATPSPAPVRPRRLADAFGDLAQPAAVIRAPGAVDIRRITPSRPVEAKTAKPAPPPHPSRVWVQVATGRNKQALGFDWRRMAREDAAVFRGKKAYVTAWGQTNRLVTGPFDTEAGANAFLSQLRRADVDGAFMWTSPAGQIVDALPAGK